jgi:hypothetical protein
MTKITKSLTNSFVKSNIKPKKIWPKHSNSADYEWIKNDSGVPWIDLKLDIPYKEILEEIKNNNKFLVDHRDEYGEHKGWKSFCIHGKSLTTTQHTEDDRPYLWIEEVKKNMPFTVEYFKSWNLNFQRLRVMALEPGGFVSVHQDGKKSTLAPVNIAITQPAGCDFVMEGWGVVPFKPGKSFMLNISNRHAVVNNSKETRYHIIVHCKELNDKFKKIIEDSYV